MLCHSKCIAVILVSALMTLVLTNSSFAQMSCNDLKYGNPFYHEKMDELAERAGFPDNYWSRYHESVVSALCSGNTKEVDSLIDGWYFEAKEVQAIAKVLNKPYKV